MQHNKLFSTIITLMLIVFLSVGWVAPKPVSASQQVGITAVFDFSTFPFVYGTFTTTGALNISGTATMDVGPNVNGARAHCEVVLYPPNGSITIHQECVFTTPIPQGRWEIVGATGAYANLKGNGSLTMPPDTEAMTGVIY